MVTKLNISRLFNHQGHKVFHKEHKAFSATIKLCALCGFSLCELCGQIRRMEEKTMAMPAARALRSKSSPLPARYFPRTAVGFPLLSLSHLSEPLILMIFLISLIMAIVSISGII